MSTPLVNEPNNNSNDCPRKPVPEGVHVANYPHMVCLLHSDLADRREQLTTQKFMLWAGLSSLMYQVTVLTGVKSKVERYDALAEVYCDMQFVLQRTGRILDCTFSMEELLRSPDYPYPSCIHVNAELSIYAGRLLDTAMPFVLGAQDKFSSDEFMQHFAEFHALLLRILAFNGWTVRDAKLHWMYQHHELYADFNYNEAVEQEKSAFALAAQRITARAERRMTQTEQVLQEAEDKLNKEVPVASNHHKDEIARIHEDIVHSATASAILYNEHTLDKTPMSVANKDELTAYQGAASAAKSALVGDVPNHYGVDYSQAGDLRMHVDIPIPVMSMKEAAIRASTVENEPIEEGKHPWATTFLESDDPSLVPLTPVTPVNPVDDCADAEYPTCRPASSSYQPKAINLSDDQLE